MYSNETRSYYVELVKEARAALKEIDPSQGSTNFNFCVHELVPVVRRSLIKVWKQVWQFHSIQNHLVV